MKNTQVFISGAGPTGLVLACQLKRFDIDFIIIDKKPDVTNLSKALGVQSRTMEIYEQMGIVDDALRECEIAGKLNLIVSGESILQVNLEKFGGNLSAYPYMFVLEQSKNEKLLYEYLKVNGGDVHWNCEYSKLEMRDDGLIVSYKNKDGEIETVHARYLVGADGASSPIRQELGFTFGGGTYEHIFAVADVILKWNLNYDELYVAVSENSFGAFFPMKGDRHYRWLGTLPKEFNERRNEITFDDIKDDIPKDLDLPVEFESSNWFSTYKVHHRYVEQFQKENVFLAGDAAHVHSPAGGQGMNTGIQDAYNLAWKMALVLQGKADEELIKTYNEERQPNAVKLINSTDKAFDLEVGSTRWMKFFRKYLLQYIAPVAVSFDWSREMIYEQISEIAISYEDYSVSKGKVGDVKAGMRLPYFKIDQNGRQISVYDLFREPKIHLVIGTRNNDLEYLIENLDENLYKVVYDDAKQIGQNLKLSDDFVMIVRPDNYIGYLSNQCNISEIVDYLKTNLHTI